MQLPAAKGGTRRIDTDSLEPAVVTQPPSEAPAANQARGVPKRWGAVGALAVIALVTSSMMIARAWWTHAEAAGAALLPANRNSAVDAAPQTGPIVEAVRGDEALGSAPPPSASDAASLPLRAADVPAHAQLSSPLAAPAQTPPATQRPLDAAEH